MELEGFVRQVTTALADLGLLDRATRDIIAREKGMPT
jgi:hypothetical protein